MWNAEPRKRRSGEAKGSSVDAGLLNNSLILKVSWLSEESELGAGSVEGCSEEIARGEKSNSESVVTNPVGYRPAPRKECASVNASTVASAPPRGEEP